MRPILFALLLAVLAQPVLAQELILSEPQTNSICIGEPLRFKLTASGPFGPQNTFILQSSSDGFKTFKNIGSIPSGAETDFVLTEPGKGLKFRVVATDPFTQGASTTGQLNIWERPGHPSLYLFPFKALVGQGFSGYSMERSKAFEYDWTAQDGSITNESTDRPVFTFAKPGTKLVTVVASNGGGCTDTARNLIEVYTCEARIPKTALVVIGEYTEVGSNPVRHVWVKPGGKYRSNNNTEISQIIYVETGGSVFTSAQPTIYAKPGASISSDGTSGYPAILFSDNVSIVPEQMALRFTCPDMQFDYSEVASSVEEEELKADLSIAMDASSSVLSLKAEGRFTVKIIDVTGRTMIDKQEMLDAGTIDLHNLSAGNYFALITRGQTTIARQIHR